MMDFSTVKGLRIPEGAVTQITDSAGRVLWVLAADIVPVRLQVQKFTSDTYAGETAYKDEQFILLDIYPKTNGTVTVTYGGITKTLTDTSGAAEPNAQQIFFGTFNGVSDSAETPESGELVIEGGCRAFAHTTFAQSSKSSNVICACIVGVLDFGSTRVLAEGAFEGATFTSMEIPSTFTTISDRAFADCKRLTSVLLPDGLIAIENQAFNGCTALKSIDLPVSLTSLAGGAFGSCPQLQSITIPELITSIGPSTFFDCRGLTEVVLPGAISSIGVMAFYNCTGLTTIVLPNSLKEIGANAFILCTALTGVVLPNSLERIDMSAFLGCDSLASIEIPESVTFIGTGAFAGGAALTTVTVRGTVPPELEGETDSDTGITKYLNFGDISLEATVLEQIIVPKGCGEAYRTAAGWSTYADYIVEES